jgi:hypothetical protein
VSERRTFEERLTARLVRRPFTDVRGRKRLYKFFARPQPHVVRHYALTLPGWPRFERPLRIAFLSDLHVGSHIDDVTRYATIAREVSALLPDLVLLGGDYMNMQLLGGGRVPPRVIARLLARMTGRHGRFAILGNHDYNYGELEVAAALRAHGIIVLDHDRGVISFGKTHHRRDGIARCPHRAAQGADLAGVAGAGPAHHRADARSRVVQGRARPGPYLTLAGPHPRWPDQAAPASASSPNRQPGSASLVAWLVVEGGRHLVVTAGLGTGGIPLRIGVPPEFRADRGDRDLTLRRIV